MQVVWNQNHNQLWRRKLRGWELDSEQDLDKVINSIKIGLQEDKLVWLGNNEQFSTRELYLKVDQFPSNNGLWLVIWKIKLPTKLKLFCWKLLNRILTVRSFLKKRLVGIVDHCSFCDKEEESLLHLFWSCPNAVEIWVQVQTWWDITLKPCKVDAYVINILNNRVIKSEFKEMWNIVAILTWWHIWKARNALIFQGTTSTPSQVVGIIKRESYYLCSNQGWISSEVSKVWPLDPLAALSQVSINKKMHFIINLLMKFEAVGFSDGAWRASDKKCGVGGVLYSKNCSLLYVLSQNSAASSALEAEIKACKLLCEVLG